MPYNLERIYLLSEIEIPLDDSEVNISLGDTSLSIADMQTKFKANVEGKINNLFQTMDQSIDNHISSALGSEIASVKTEFQSAIEQTKSSMLMRVSEIYTTSNSMEEFKSQISTLFQQTSNSIDMYFSTVESRVTALDDTVSTSISNQNQYIRFIDGDIYLGEVGNPLILKITNNRISFYSNNVEIAYFSSGRLYVDQLEAITSLTLGSYAFLPNKTGGMTLKYIGT